MSEPEDRSRAENMEQLAGLAKGDKGDKGDAGDRGAQGLSQPVRRALVYLFATAAALALVALLTVFQQQRHNAAVQQQQAATQARQARLIEAKLCTTLGKLAALKPPAGDPAKNPSRAFDDQLHATLSQLGPDLGCGRQSVGLTPRG